MGRLLRIGGVLLLAAALILIGIEVGMFIRLNDAWVTLRWPVPAAGGLTGFIAYESPVWVLCLGWVVAALLVVAAVLWLPVYLTRRRRTNLELLRLEREVAELRNLPIKTPAPLADLPAGPDEAADKPLEPEIGAEE
jgi:hypothetical protein